MYKKQPSVELHAFVETKAVWVLLSFFNIYLLGEIVAFFSFNATKMWLNLIINVIWNRIKTQPRLKQSLSSAIDKCQ